MGGAYLECELLLFIMWEMASANDEEARAILKYVQAAELEDVLLFEVHRIYKQVRRWEFPVEHGLASAIPEAVECTFPELIRSMVFACDQLVRVRNMLVGLNMRLDLREADRAVQGALSLLSKELIVLQHACGKIGDGDDLAPEFPDEEPGEGRSWASSNGAPLSPQQILDLSVLALANYPTASLTYEEGISRHSAAAPLIAERIKAGR